MTMASPFLPWCRMRADDHQPVPNFAPFLSGSRTPVYPGHGLPPFGLQTEFPHSVLQSGPRPIYGFPRPDTQPTFGYPPCIPDQRPLYPYSRPMGGVIERDVTHSTEVSRVGTATGSPKTDLNPDPEDPDESGSVSSRHSDTRQSESDDDSTQTNDIKSKYPDYCRTLTVTDASGQIKELVFPKALDLDRPKRARTTFSPDQLVTLEREFHKNQYLVGRERTDLAQRLGLSETQVKVWFQNRRTKFKRDKTREAEEEKIRAESSAACNILRILQDRRVAPPSAPPPALPDPGTASPVGHQVSLGVGPSPQPLDKSASRGVTTDDGNRVTSCPFPAAGSRGLSHNMLFYT